MFNILYRCPRTVARHENGRLRESRRSSLEHLSAQGAALRSLRGAAGIIYRAAVGRKPDESSPVDRKEIERTAKRWAHRSYRNASSRGPEQTDKEFRQTTCNGLRFAAELRGIGSYPSAASAGDRRALSRYGRGPRSVTCYGRNCSPQPPEVLQAHPRAATLQAQDRGCGSVPRSAGASKAGHATVSAP
jgi:hypothetical protein